MTYKNRVTHPFRSMLFAAAVLLLLLVTSLSASAQTTGCSTNCLRVFNIRMVNQVDRVTGLVTVVDENGGRIFGAVVHATWTKPDGSVVDQYANIGVRGRAEFSLYPTASGLYTLTVVDIVKDGYTFDPANSNTLTGSISFTAPTQNQAPTAVASADSLSGPAPLTVNFSSAGSTDPDGTLVAYAWNFGDGSSSTAVNPSYTYNTAGSYTATLTVTDSDGATDTASLTITATDNTTSCSVNCLRVYSIKMYDFGTTISGHVVVVDENGGRIFGAVVHAVWTKPDGSTQDQYDMIGVRGRAEFPLYASVSGQYTLTVVGITKDGYTFDPANSALLSSSINVIR